MNKFMKTVGALIVLAGGAVASSASADTVPAIAGRAWLPSEVGCFSTGSFSNQVQNSGCSGLRSWLVPITLRATGNTNFRASSSFVVGSIGTVPQCRMVLRANNDSSVVLGGLTTIAGQDVTLGTFSVPNASTTGHVDCILNQATPRFGLTQVRW